MYPYSSSEFGRTSFESCYLTWHGDDSEGTGFYIGPLSSCQEDFFYKSGSQDYRDEDDVNEHADPSFRDLAPTHVATGSGNLLGDYLSHFVGWGEDNFSKGYGASDDRFNGLDIVEDQYRHEKLSGSHEISNKEIETQFRVEHSPWYDCDFGFQYGVDEDYGAAEPESRYSQSWESWDEMRLYEKIFGNWHSR